MLPLRAALRATLLPLALAGCLGPTEPPRTILREGQLVPVSGSTAPIEGSVAMVARPFETDIGIGVAGALEGQSFVWLLVHGSCAVPGEGAAAASIFPTLFASASGAAQAETRVNRRLSGTSYAVVVSLVDDGTEIPSACADLIEL